MGAAEAPGRSLEDAGGRRKTDGSVIRPQTERLLARTDPHSPPRYRVHGLVVNVPEFAQAFSCKPGQPMVKPKEKICRVWRTSLPRSLGTLWLLTASISP
jgi:hypothetical protein